MADYENPGRVSTWGELKQWAQENGITDDMPVWLGKMVAEGGCMYYNGQVKTDPEVMTDTQTWGIFLPKEHQVKEIGMVLY